MKSTPQSAEQLLLRLKQLPPERRAEVADFVEFLAQREDAQAETAAIARISEPALEQIWDNEDDAAYDAL